MTKFIAKSITALLVGASLLPCAPVHAASITNETIKQPGAQMVLKSTTRHPVPVGYKGYVYITGNYVNIRNGNSVSRGTLMRGDRVYINGLIDGQGWYSLNGERVYIAGQYLSTVKE
ncbi:hypothetical protein [Clostridium estertheticum]|uniref:hypothetical protein n=1 Tax=Clostridium estertheticum TaxID=238834 RepID=UPI001C7DC628|nr:hypothetical protein [Clostridium estertheticum]MBX4267215.1 hypothetical protein [Clostridium estertheticum]MBX4271889.1 hypothetical protein [Clostridium estertheticum]WLC82392.1 hypothetical protein KTC98_23755 [Clostridium estertheticum]WLC91262.1 hypothetical protein KTC95_23695 [Clostridium estertheticum]